MLLTARPPRGLHQRTQDALLAAVSGHLASPGKSFHESVLAQETAAEEMPEEMPLLLYILLMACPADLCSGAECAFGQQMLT